MTAQIAQTARTAGPWNPQVGKRTGETRMAYLGGYSDGFYGYSFNQADWPDCYRKGYDEGRDARAAL